MFSETTKSRGPRLLTLTVARYHTCPPPQQHRLSEVLQDGPLLVQVGM